MGDRFFRHAEHDRACLVLCHCERAGLVHFVHAACAVVAHSGHDHAHRVCAGGTCGGAEQHVDRGPVPADQWAFPDGNLVACAAALKQHVFVARRDQNVAAKHRIAVDGFLHLDFAKTVQALGKGGGKLFRHVLDNNHARRICRQRF
ncbi:hypothetical protein D3C73_990010 [compost metagenome]